MYQKLHAEINWHKDRKRRAALPRVQANCHLLHPSQNTEMYWKGNQEKLAWIENDLSLLTAEATVSSKVFRFQYGVTTCVFCSAYPPRYQSPQSRAGLVKNYIWFQFHPKAQLYLTFLHLLLLIYDIILGHLNFSQYTNHQHLSNVNKTEKCQEEKTKHIKTQENNSFCQQRILVGKSLLEVTWF